MQNLISIIIPAYNGAEYIAETIEGIKRQKMDVEIIVVDDCSADNTAEIAEDLGCHVIRHTKNTGQVIGKNTGIRAAKGSYVIFNDQDDIMRDGALQRLFQELGTDKVASAVMAKSQDFLSPDAQSVSSFVKTEAVWGMFTGATLFRKEVFDIIGLFDESVKLNTGETIIVMSKMKEHNLEMKKIDFISVDRRIHDNNFGITNQKKEYQDYASVLRAKLVSK